MFFIVVACLDAHSLKRRKADLAAAEQAYFAMLSEHGD